MRIHNIVIDNYRSYVKEQKIVFDLDEKKNVTVILGVNGSGKTNLLNAINWCLYGDEPHLSKYAAKKPLINQTVFSKLKEGDSTKCKVKITLGKSKPRYQIERVAIFKKNNGKPEKLKESFRVDIISDRGWMEAPDPVFMVNNHLLPKKIRDYFLFDGERLNDFFKGGNEALIKEAILDVVQIGLISKAERHLSDVLEELRAEVARIAPNTKDILEKIEMYERSINTQEELKKTKEQEKITALKQLEDIKKILREHPSALIKELQETRDDLDEEIKRLNGRLTDLKNENEERILTDAPFVISIDAIQKALEIISREFTEDRLPPLVEDTFLKRVLKKKRCICGLDLSKNPKNRKVLETFLETIPKNTKELTDTAYTELYILENIKKIANKFLDMSIEYNKKIKKIDFELEEKNKKRREISERITKYPIEKIQNLEENFDKLEQALREINVEINEINNNIERLNISLNYAQDEFKKESRKEEKASYANLKFNFCEQSLAILTEIKNELIDEIRLLIETKTKEYFLNLIWKKKAYKEINIDETYKLSVIDTYGTSCLGSLSAGERQVLALSFMAALYEVSGFDMPAIIDTPLGRISGEPRENIAKCLPEYLKKVQLTLLILDTEYTEVVKKFLSKRVGREYKLKFDDERSETEVIRWQ